MLQRIGRYEILERIAAGGQGTVYRGRDTVLDRVVAAKPSISRLPTIKLFSWEPCSGVDISIRWRGHERRHIREYSLDCIGCVPSILTTLVKAYYCYLIFPSHGDCESNDTVLFVH